MAAAAAQLSMRIQPPCVGSGCGAGAHTAARPAAVAPRSHHTARCASGSGSGGAGGPAAGFRGLGRCRASTAPPSALSAPIDYFAQPSEDCEELMTKLHNPAALQSSIGLPLTAEEQRSLLLCLQSANLGVDTCLVEGMGALSDHVMRFVEHVGATHSENLEVVEGALVLLEQLAIMLGRVDPEGPVALAVPVPGVSASGVGASPPAPPLPKLQGRWQMVVTTAGGWPQRLQYIPVLEYFEVMPDLQHFKLDTKLGPLFVTFMGELEWRAPDYVNYHVADVKMEFFGSHSLVLPAPVPDNGLRVFAMGKDVAVARSKAGGLLLMTRPI